MTAKIEWLNAGGRKAETWNPIVGCSKCSPGCYSCWAERMATRQRAMGNPAYVAVTNPDGIWNGKTTLVESALDKPLHWKQPRNIAVCLMGDLFHESVPATWFSRVWDVMTGCPQHTFFLLTKRPDRMAIFSRRVNSLDNVWFGVSVCTQAEANEKIPILCHDVTARYRFVSVEPMLREIDFGHLFCAAWRNGYTLGIFPDWFLIGGESGPKARPFNPNWARDVIEMSKGTQQKVFVKQLGSAAGLRDSRGADPSEWPADLRVREYTGALK